jgi:predicted nucleic acid-binding protein
MIVDASVAMKWLRPEPDTAAALQLLDRIDLTVPDSLYWELGHALTRLRRQRIITADAAREVWERLNGFVINRVHAGAHVDEAFDFSLRLNASFYDCLYLALAVAVDDVLVSADQRFINTATAAGLSARVVPLAAAVA